MRDLLAAIVRGDDVAMEALPADLDVDRFCCAATEHGILPLVMASLLRRPSAPPSLIAALRRRTAEQTAVDLVREMDLREIVRAFEVGRVAMLLMKGAQLAYSHYPRPDLRPRVDTDVLIPASARPQAGTLLARLGYAPQPNMGGDLVLSQQTWVRRRLGVPHAVDLHWNVSNPRLFAGFLAFDELARSASALPALDAAARGLGPVHALLMACVHRVAHHFGADCLIWLYDIHLIASRLTPIEWQRFADLAEERRVVAVCRASLRHAADWLDTPVPPGLWTRADASGSSAQEPTARYLEPRRRPVSAVLDDLRALPTWTDRWRLMREHAFPPALYMRTVYAPSSAAPLPVLYARRVWRGARKWLEKQES